METAFITCIWQHQFLHRMWDLHGYSDCVRWIQLYLPLVWGSRFPDKCVTEVLHRSRTDPGASELWLGKSVWTVLTLLWVVQKQHLPLYSWGSGTSAKLVQTNLIIQENIHNFINYDALWKYLDIFFNILKLNFCLMHSFLKAGQHYKTFQIWTNF